MVAASRLVAAVATASAAVNGFSFDINTMMKIKAFSSRFEADSIQNDQKIALMEKYGFNDMQLFMSKQITGDEYKTSMKQQMKDQLIQNILNEGGLDLSNPIVRKGIFGDQDNMELLADFTLTPEPLKSIMRLIKLQNVGQRKIAGKTSFTATELADLKTYGKELLKKYQYKQFNQAGNAFTENFDEILLVTGEDRKKVIKEIMEQSMFEQIENPIERSLMYYIREERKTTDATRKAELKSNIKSLQMIRLFDETKPSGSPVTDENMFAFYRMVEGKVDPADILNVALGEQLGPINSQEFERYFGAPAKQFSCRAHSSVLRVPCGIKLKADECVAAGCCYMPSTSSSSDPECFHDLYGKIGSGILRKAWIGGDNTAMSQQIQNLFPDNTIPSLDKILKDQTPFGGQLYAKGATGAKAGIYSNEYPTGMTNWWDASRMPAGSFESGPNDFPKGGKDESYPSRDMATFWANGNAYDHGMNGGARPAYGNPNQKYGNPNAKKWKPHGPTQSPFFAEMPGINPTANPLANGLGTLDEYYRIWLEFAEAQDSAQCALIPAASRVKCMDNFEALVDNRVNQLVGGVKSHKNTKCYQAGCCFNEDAFLEAGKDKSIPAAACYRAPDYGTCTNLPKDFVKTECGFEGINESECLVNPKCCYKPSADRKDPWCYYKFSNTLDENQWCDAWSDPKYFNLDRQKCFNDAVKKTGFLQSNNPASNINNLVSEEQCLNAGCCFDRNLDVDVIEWMTEGLGLNQGRYRCFQKLNPQVAATGYGTNIVGQKVDGGIAVDKGLKEVDNAAAGKKINPHDYTLPRKTCDASKWNDLNGSGKGLVYKRSCGENLSYYQCVYVNKCCYKPTVSNEPACYQPELSNTYTGAYVKKDNTVVGDAAWAEASKNV